MAQADVLVNGARSIITNLLGGLGGTAPNYMAIGSGSTTAVAADTALTTEFTTGTWAGYARINATPTRSTQTLSNDKLTWVGTFTAPATVSVWESGLLDASSAGNLFEHSSYAAAVGLSNGDKIQVTTTYQAL
jgi:hypothetical protein